VEPAAVEPAAVEPAAVEPAAVEPALEIFPLIPVSRLNRAAKRREIFNQIFDKTEDVIVKVTAERLSLQEMITLEKASLEQSDLEEAVIEKIVARLAALEYQAWIPEEKPQAKEYPEIVKKLMGDYHRGVEINVDSYGKFFMPRGRAMNLKRYYSASTSKITYTADEENREAIYFSLQALSTCFFDHRKKITMKMLKTIGDFQKREFHDPSVNIRMFYNMVVKD